MGENMHRLDVYELGYAQEGNGEKPRGDSEAGILPKAAL